MSSDNTTIIGAMPPPPGVTPNFVNPESVGWQLILVAVLSAIISTSTYLLRLYTSYFILKKWFLDDFFIAVALVFGIAFSIVMSMQTANGAGLHLWDIPVTHFKNLLKLGVIGGAITYNLATLCTKVSVLLYYMRFTVDPLFKILAYCIMIVAIGYSLGQAFSFTYLCNPMQSFWDFDIPGTCIDINLAFIVSAGLNVGVDFVILFLPIWLLYPLHIRTRQKIAVTIILMIGGFVCIVSVIRLAKILAGLSDPDFTWQPYIMNQTWCVLEMHIGIVCACLPCLKALLKRHFPTTTNRSATTHPSISLGKMRSSNTKPASTLERSRIQKEDIPRPGTADSLTGPSWFVPEGGGSVTDMQSELDDGDSRRNDKPASFNSGA